MYGDLDIIVLGHSMGGAMTAFYALNLKLRIGYAIFASYYSKLLPNTICRGEKDHSIYRLSDLSFLTFLATHYVSSTINVWPYDIEYESLVYSAEKVCDDCGEDASCSSSVLGNRLTYHLVYLGFKLQADNPCLAKFTTVDPNGNIIFGKQDSIQSEDEDPIKNQYWP
ncbi:hypothetical protein V2J09_009251 [Rumex salicifolius]